MTLRLLIIGRTGQVATELQNLAGPDLQVTALGREEADLAVPADCAVSIETAIETANADVIINAAAYTDVDGAEENEALATRINAEAPGVMARTAAAHGLPFLHISTDYIFDGNKPGLWVEDDPPAPLGAYGRSKLAGEQAVAEAGGEHLILRTAWVFSSHGRNFVRTMLRVGAERESLNVVDDQYGGPTAAADIAKALVVIARSFHQGRAQSGIFHYAGAPSVTWCGFARAIFARADWMQGPQIQPIRTEDWPTPAARPRNSVLDCSRVEGTFGIPQPDWRTSLDLVMAELRPTKPQAE